MELISFLGKLFGYTPEIANVISGELRSVSEARRRPKVLHFLCNLFIYAEGFYPLAPNCSKMPQQAE